MHHAVPLITTIAAAFGMALILGFVTTRLGLPALVGYMLAGIVIGPATPGLVADVGIAGQLAEVGVMLLMFGVGLHFSLQDLLAVRKIALPGAVVQMAVATALGTGVATWWGWNLAAALVFGLALSVASTVVLLKALENKGLLESVNGRVAVGWLVVEDLAMVLVLVLLPPLAGIASGNEDTNAAALWWALGRTLLEVAAFVVLMLVVGRRLFPWLLRQVTRTGSRELFTLCVAAAAVSIAYGSAQLFGVSFALGAFFAGMVLRESEFSHRAAEETLPLRDAFAVLFFVSVGMLFEPSVLVEQPMKVLAVVGIIVLGKSLAAALLVLLLRYPIDTALTVSAGLAQIGEFSFILAGLGMSLGVLPAAGQSLILAGALISIAANPLVFSAVELALRWKRQRSARVRTPDEFPTEPSDLVDARHLENHVVIVGYDRVGQGVAAALQAHSIPFVVVEESREIVERLRGEGIAALQGNAAEPAALIQGHFTDARLLVVTTPQAPEMRPIVETARRLNPKVHLVVRSRSSEEAALLEREHGGKAFVAEGELARAMSVHVLAQVAAFAGGAR